MATWPSEKLSRIRNGADRRNECSTEIQWKTRLKSENLMEIPERMMTENPVAGEETKGENEDGTPTLQKGRKALDSPKA